MIDHYEMTVTAIDAALGKRPFDVVVQGSSVLNVHTGELGPASIGIAGGTIAVVGEISDAELASANTVVDWRGRVVVPAFIDSHFHIGGSQLATGELARLLHSRGTTTIACDLQEIYSFAGLDGVRLELDVAREAGLRILFLPAAHILGLEQRGRYRHAVSADEMRTMLAWPEAVGINEPPPTTVLRGHEGTLRLLAEARARRMVVSGHAPGLAGRMLQAYAAAGATSDHESQTDVEALEKLRLGMSVMLREGSAAVDLERIAPLLTAVPDSRRFSMVCSDEQDAPALTQLGNVDQKLRLLVRAGVDPVEAVRMGTINTAQYYRVDDRLGSVSPGRVADLVALRDLETFEVTDVVVGGRLAVTDGSLTAPYVRRDCPAILRSDVRRPEPITADTFRVEAAGGHAEVRVLGVADGSLLTDKDLAAVTVEDGNARPDPANDVLKLAVLERHGGGGGAATGFIGGFGLRNGAVATTYNHIHYNMLVVGTSEEQMATAARELAELGGGVVVVADGVVVKRWSLPIAGVCSLESFETVERELAETNGALVEHGCRLSSAVLALSLIAVTTIPGYGFTEHGLYDAEAEAFVPVVVGP